VTSESETLPEGSDGFELDEACTRELEEALAEADRREVISEEEFWKQVRPRSAP
jgi:hypothetical protein